MPKDTSLDEVTSNSEKIKPIALAVIELCLSEGNRQAGSWTVENPIAHFLKFCDNLLKAFRIVQKTLLGLVIVLSRCQDGIMKLVFGWPERPKPL